MAKWTRSNDRPITSSRTLVRNTETGEEGFVGVQWSNGTPQLFGAVSVPRLDESGMERPELPDGTPDAEVLDTRPTFV